MKRFDLLVKLYEDYLVIKRRLCDLEEIEIDIDENMVWDTVLRQAQEKAKEREALIKKAEEIYGAMKELTDEIRDEIYRAGIKRIKARVNGYYVLIDYTRPVPAIQKEEVRV